MTPFSDRPFATAPDTGEPPTGTPATNDAAPDWQDEVLIGLVGRCALRDQAALKQIFERVGPYLNAVALRILKSRELANEVLQEAFLQIWHNAASYRPHKARALTWMASIVRYRALDRLASEQRLRTHFVSEGDLPQGDEGLSDQEPEQALHSGQMKFHLHQCLRTLGDNIKCAIELAYLYGYSREEIAKYLQTNTNTVKSWLHRGAERLKLCLATKH